MTWIAYDAISGDAQADGPEHLVLRYVNAAEEASGGQHALVAASEPDWRRAARAIASRMSGNPPRRNPPGIEHLAPEGSAAGHTATAVPRDGRYLVSCPHGCDLGTSADVPDERAAQSRIALHRKSTTPLVPPRKDSTP